MIDSWALLAMTQLGAGQELETMVPLLSRLQTWNVKMSAVVPGLFGLSVVEWEEVNAIL